ncbi:DNA internalization-related competence protein ComEC/Rec2 [Serpentinimonas maccroryi]|nr:DNA internalization-related competence protein ComEC/Rec2 [Serpentinimonas maccroryi]
MDKSVATHAALALGLPLMLGGIGGAWLQLQQPLLWSAGAYGALAAAALLLGALLWGRQPGLGGARQKLWSLGWLLVGAGLLFASTGGRALWFQAGALDAQLEGRDLVLEGYVAGLPRQGELGWQFEFVVLQASLAEAGGRSRQAGPVGQTALVGGAALPGEAAPPGQSGQAVQVPQRLRLAWFAPRPGRGQQAQAGAQGANPGQLAQAGAQVGVAGLPELRAGQRWRLTACLQRPHGLANPGGFDFELRLWEQGIHATGSVRAGPATPAPQLLGHGWQFPLQQARQWVRDRMLERVQPAATAGVLAALVVGDQGAIPQAHWETFRVTGVTHLMVVSGTHITLFAWMAMALIGLLWRLAGRRLPALLLAVPTPVAAALGGLALGFLYALFSGWGVPAQRAVLMLATLVLLQLSGRQWPWPFMWLAVMQMVVLLDPWALLSPGFWLSFVAVAILFATGQPLPTDGRSGRHYVLGLVRTQALMTLALAPLLLLWFGEFSLVGLLANLPAIPWVTLLVTPLALAGVLIWPLWLLAGWMVDALMLWLQALQQWPWATVSRPALPLLLAVLAAMGGLLLVLRWPWSLRAWGLLLIWPALAYSPARPPPGHFEWLAADIGQGTAVIVRTQNHTLVYDTGPPMGPHSDAAERVLLPLLQRHGEAPTKVLISHIDSDHASGIATLARAHPQAQWLTSFDTQPWGLSSQRCLAGQSWVWDGVPFRILHPGPDDYAARRPDNAMSCVLQVGQGAASLLLPGDIYIEEETRLALAQPDLRAGVLLAAHHGSRTSSGPVWLNTLQPQWVVIQAAHRSRYGHPHPQVLARLQERGIPWVATPLCGAAWGSSQRPDELHCQRQQRQRYWQHPDGRGALPAPP